MQKRVSIIGCAGVPANYGGFETLADNLVTELQGAFRFTVYCSAYSYPERLQEYKQARLIYIPLKANGRSSVFYDIISIFHAVNKSDVLLVLGVGGAFVFPLLRLFSRKVLVVNIDGLEWRRDKWGRFAKFYLKLQERLAVTFAHKVIADNEAIQSYVREEYNRDSIYAPYGGDHTRQQALTPALRNELALFDGPYCFTVCRIEPENNIHVILAGFSRTPEMNLIIVGNWQASKYGKNLVAAYKDFANIRLLDPIYDIQKLDALRGNCQLYVHGHSAGGTNPSLVEAMNLGLAIVAWDVNYNRNTTDCKALYFDSADALVKVLHSLATSAANLQANAREMQRIAKTKFTWAGVANKYKEILL